MAEVLRRNERGRAHDRRDRRERGARLLATLLFLVLGSGVVVGLGPRAAGAAEPSPTPVTVRIKPGGLDPAHANAKSGGTVIWVNDSKAVRSIVANDASFMSGPLEPGEQFQFAFTEPRTVSYDVPELPGATGTVVVGNGGSGPPPAPTVPIASGPPAAAPQPVPSSEFAYTGTSSAVNALIGGLALAVGAGLLALGHRLGWTAALTGWAFASSSDDLLPSRRHRRVRKAEARRGGRVLRAWERRRP